MSNESLLDFQWSTPVQSEILVKVIMAHGDWDVFEEKTLRFPDTASGQKSAKLAIEALPHLSEVVEGSGGRGREELWTLVAQRVNASAGELFKMFEPLVEMDLKYEKYAIVAALRIDHQTPQQTRRAVFATTQGGTVPCHLKALTSIPTYGQRILSKQTGDTFAPSVLLETGDWATRLRANSR